MGQVYGRMSLASVSSRSPSGDHHTSCPSKAKPDCRNAKKQAGSAALAIGRNQRWRSLSVGDNQDSSDHDDGETGNQTGVRMTRHQARLQAQQQAAQQAATVRRSVRLALVGRVPTSGGSRLVNNRSINVRGAGAASLPTTLRRSARIAGFRYIGHRVAADFNSSSSASGPAAAALGRRRQQSAAMGGVGELRPHSSNCATSNHTPRNQYAQGGRFV